MANSLAKRLKQDSVALSDLDGLLVNSDNFNQLFVQRIDPEWMTNTINRVVKSDAHLKRLTHILVSFITSERHPDWVYHALVWLTHLLHSPARERFARDPGLLDICRPLIAHMSEMSGMKDLLAHADARGAAIKHWANGLKSASGIPHKYYYGGLFEVPSTGYVYIDDSEDEFGQRSARLRAKRHSRRRPTTSPSKPSEMELVGSLSDLEDVDLVEGEDDNLDDTDVSSHSDPGTTDVGSESDHGVFDVNETASSDDPPAPETPSASLVPRKSILFPANPSDRQQLSVDLDNLSHDDEIEGDDAGLDEQPSSDSDEELDLLMWTRGETSDSSADSGNDVTDQAPQPPLAAGGRRPNNNRTPSKQKTPQPKRLAKTEPRRSARLKAPEHPEASNSKKKRARKSI